MEEISVSLIIPVYNVSGYLGKCLDSVVAQTYSRLEVIIVNDGSTDDSPRIAEEYASRHPHFHLYTIENRGLGGARNYGIERASGDYLLFLDSDDYIAPDCIEKMASAARADNSDIVVASCYDVREDGTVISAYDNSHKSSVTSLYDEHCLLFNRPSAWGKLFKRKLLGDLRFVSREWYEDMRLIPKLYLSAERITYIDDRLFYYVQRSGSIMNSGNAERNLEVINAFEDLLSYYKAQGKYSEFRNELEFLVIEHVAVSAIGRIASSKSKNKKELISRLQAYLSDFDGLYDNPYLPTQDRNRKIVLWLNRHRLYFMTGLLLSAKQAAKNK